MSDPVAPPTCARHPAKWASVVCARCERPICTDCMIQAAVGWQCPDCVSAGAKKSPTIRPKFALNRNRSGVLGYSNPTPVVIGLIAINVAVFFASGFGHGSQIGRFLMAPNHVHYLHQYYRLFDAMFLHANVGHIVLNMASLLIIGPAVEVLLGRTRFLTLYLIAGLGGSVGSYLFDLGPSLGASGAILGVMGAYLVLAWRRGLPMQQIVLIVAINLIFGFTVANVDWHAHVGGLLVGGLLALLYNEAERIRAAAQRITLTVMASAATLGVLALLVGTIAPHPSPF